MQSIYRNTAGKSKDYCCTPPILQGADAVLVLVWVKRDSAALPFAAAVPMILTAGAVAIFPF